MIPGKEGEGKNLDVFLITFIFTGLYVNASYLISVCKEPLR